jgi:hypothetical protein
MTRNKLVVVIITILAVNTILTGLLGDKGVLVNNQLKKMLPVMQEELQILVKKNKNLTELKISFEADYHKILNEAYRYGYLQEDEFRIIYNAYTSYDSGLVSSAKLGNRIRITDGILKQKQIYLISILSGVITYIILVLYQILKKNRIKRDTDS